MTGPAARRDRVIGALCGIAVVLLFSSFTLISRLGLASSLQLMDIAALRFSISGVLMAPVLWHYGLSSVRWRDAAALAYCGGLGFALLAFTGFSLAPAAHGGVLLHGTLALTTFALGWITARTRATAGRAVGLMAISVGVVAMAWDSVAGSSGRQLLGDGALLLCVLQLVSLWVARPPTQPETRSLGVDGGGSVDVLLYTRLPDAARFGADDPNCKLEGVAAAGDISGRADQGGVNLRLQPRRRIAGRRGDGFVHRCGPLRDDHSRDLPARRDPKPRGTGGRCHRHGRHGRRYEELSEAFDARRLRSHALPLRSF